MNAIEEIKKRIKERMALLEGIKRQVAGAGMDSLCYHLMVEGLRMALREIEGMEGELLEGEGQEV